MRQKRWSKYFFPRGTQTLMKRHQTYIKNGEKFVNKMKENDIFNHTCTHLIEFVFYIRANAIQAHTHKYIHTQNFLVL